MVVHQHHHRPGTEGTVVVEVSQAGDDNYNSASETVSFEVTATDVTAPVADVETLPILEEECSLIEAIAPTATDNVDGTITGTTDVVFPIMETTTITWTYTDVAGNTSTQEQSVIIEDLTAPTFTCVENQVFDLEAGQTVYTVSGTDLDPTDVEDNCNIASIGVVNIFNNVSTLDGAEFPVGTTTVTWTITDDAGNSATCSYTVTVNAFVSISDLSELEISIYPNPSNGQFIIENAEGYHVTITDITGKQIYNSNIDTDSKSIDLNNVSIGIYMINFSSENKNFSSKLIINK